MSRRIGNYVEGEFISIPYIAGTIDDEIVEGEKEYVIEFIDDGDGTISIWGLDKDGGEKYITNVPNSEIEN